MAFRVVGHTKSVVSQRENDERGFSGIVDKREEPPKDVLFFSEKGPDVVGKDTPLPGYRMAEGFWFTEANPSGLAARM